VCACVCVCVWFLHSARPGKRCSGGSDGRREEGVGLSKRGRQVAQREPQSESIAGEVVQPASRHVRGLWLLLLLLYSVCVMCVCVSVYPTLRLQAVLWGNELQTHFTLEYEGICLGHLPTDLFRMVAPAQERTSSHPLIDISTYHSFPDVFDVLLGWRGLFSGWPGMFAQHLPGGTPICELQAALAANPKSSSTARTTPRSAIHAVFCCYNFVIILVIASSSTQFFLEVGIGVGFLGGLFFAILSSGATTSQRRSRAAVAEPSCSGRT
jgi:hypothetical protein